MDLVGKFKMASSCQTVKVSSLMKDKPYLIEHVEKVQIRYGEAVLLNLRESPLSCEDIFTETVCGPIYRGKSSVHQ
jgi:hypothetical protein